MGQNNTKKAFLIIMICSAAAIGCGQMRDNRAATADNTAVNERDRNAGAVTADQQKENKTDRELTAAIRTSVMADKSLSTYARNVKIVSQDGRVTLKGPVRSNQEKASIVATAVAAAGDKSRVTDEMSVAP